MRIYGPKKHRIQHAGKVLEFNSEGFLEVEKKDLPKILKFLQYDKKSVFMIDGKEIPKEQTETKEEIKTTGKSKKSKEAKDASTSN